MMCMHHQLKFYQTNEKNAKFVTNKGCEYIGELIVDMPDTIKGRERSVEASIYFGETEITVYGEVQKTQLNLLMKKK